MSSYWDEISTFGYDALQNGPSQEGRMLASVNEYAFNLQSPFEVDSGRIVGTTVFILIFGSLGAAAGIGGGGLFVPVYAFLLGAGTKGAVPLSKATILGAALGNFAALAYMKHPEADRPIIDYEVVTIMMPGILLGVIVGVLLNILLPEILILVFLVCVLSFSSFKTLRKGYSKWCAESEAIEKAKETTGDVELGQVEVEVAAAEIAPALVLVGSKIETPYGTGEIVEHREGRDGVLVVSLPFGTAYLHPEASPEAMAAVNAAKKQGDNGVDAQERDRSPSVALALLQDEYRIQFPLWAYLILCATTVVSIIYGYIKSAHISPCNGVGYWIFYFAPIPIFAVFLWITKGIVEDRYLRRKDCPTFEFHENDLRWNPDMLVMFPAIACFAGLTSGLLGIGGGMINGPLFVAMNLHPRVATSSCAFEILWTAISGVLLYAFAGKLGFAFIIWCVCIGFVAGLVGQFGLDAVLKRSGRPSLVVLLLGSIVAAACVGMLITGSLKIASDIGVGKNLLYFNTDDFMCLTAVPSNATLRM